jgi:hypothetical protein
MSRKPTKRLLYNIDSATIIGLLFSSNIAYIAILKHAYWTTNPPPYPFPLSYPSRFLALPSLSPLSCCPSFHPRQGLPERFEHGIKFPKAIADMRPRLSSLSDTDNIPPSVGTVRGLSADSIMCLTCLPSTRWVIGKRVDRSCWMGVSTCLRRVNNSTNRE